MKRAIKYKFLIENLPWTVATKELKHYFSRFGEIHSASVDFDKNTGFSRGTGLVFFTSARKLETLHREQHTIHGTPIKVSLLED